MIFFHGMFQNYLLNVYVQYYACEYNPVLPALLIHCSEEHPGFSRAIQITEMQD